jgi:DNA (cytosine-5)-methyltransferase 1
MIALDLFAGTGWGVACQRLGILEHGVEIMPEAVASRAAAGMHTAYHDVWDGLADPNIIPTHDLLIASPPCQTFSVAGKGAGRKALDDVLALIDTGAWAQNGTALHDAASAAGLDDRTALVLSPLAYVAHAGPMHVVLEQVPTVLPVWEAVAVQLRALGYSVVTGVLNAEQYGVPQTRRRAILVARRDGHQAAMPTPTHSRYYSRSPERLDPDVLPWVSMASALGWGMTERPSPTITGGGTETGGAEPIAKLARYTGRGDWVPKAMAGSGTSCTTTDPRPVNSPAQTITGGANAEWGDRLTRAVGPRDRDPSAVRLTPPQAAVLQSYPADFPFQGNQGDRFLQIGNAVPPLLGQAVIAAAIEGALSEEKALAA